MRPIPAAPRFKPDPESSHSLSCRVCQRITGGHTVSVSTPLPYFARAWRWACGSSVPVSGDIR